MANEGSTVDLFADDLMRLVMARLSVRLQLRGTQLEVLLVDNQTGHGVVCTGAQLMVNTIAVPAMYGNPPESVAAQT